MEHLISGIQQVGIGVNDAETSVRWYSKHFGFNALVFNDEAEAALMTKYTGNQVHKRQAYLTLNMQGGGGFETWQFTSRKPADNQNPILGGELGINAVKLKCKSPITIIQRLQADGVKTLETDNRFWVYDLHGNWFELVPFDDWFQFPHGVNNGGVCGANIGVSNLEKSVRFYCSMLGFKPVGDKFTFEVNGRMIKSQKIRFNNLRQGAFSGLLGNVELELWESDEGKSTKIFQDRFWGDTGFIHLCFDVINMPKLKERFNAANHDFVVDSADSFAMGSAAGRFAYVEDPDGTLLELVETHKVPIFKKLGIYYPLKNRKHQNPLPAWQVKLLGMQKVK